MEGNVGNFVRCASKEVFLDFNVGVLQRRCEDNRVEWLLIGIGFTGTNIPGRGSDIVFALVF